MTRRNSGPANKGSRFHLQKMVNLNQDYLNHLMLSNSPSLKEYSATQPVWVSPLEIQDYYEYRGSAFLKVLGLYDSKQRLGEFWPSPGPYWDALATFIGKGEKPGVILLEAKSHLKELGNSSYACGANGKGLDKIISSLSNVKTALGVERTANWLGCYL